MNSEQDLTPTVKTEEEREKQAKYMRRYTKEIESPEARARRCAKRKEQFATWRKACIDALGCKCVRCGFEDYRALQIDHVNGDGQEDRRRRGFNSGYNYRFYEQIMSEPDFKQNYQLLCANCNWIKRAENREFNQGVLIRPPRKYIN